MKFNTGHLIYDKPSKGIGIVVNVEFNYDAENFIYQVFWFDIKKMTWSLADEVHMYCKLLSLGS